ncbi:DUF11 domain-containing protein [Persicitalea jodogahamensis]|uniref:DUF11 domain-containing protein n=1 Tax=Persicitalea jodogahamensis TaxID=402147 RepID=A0A8J3G8K9_9BACT|nr:DUF11 domain-containing protein [Persicitalea jodogahamensis]GHB67284.1 hypothetical protein GCM10007390_20740 [Persicitalea jodogahamensis]
METIPIYRRPHGLMKCIRTSTVNIVIVLLTIFHFSHAQVATQTFNTAGTYTFTVPIGVNSITVQAWGGGGGARGDGTSNRGAGGGGAYASSTLSVTQGTTFTVVVGAGGVATGNPGQSGQASVFGNNQVVADGGSGGTNSGGAGGTVAGSIGTTRFAGGAGGNRGGTTGVGGGGGGGGSAFSTGNGNNGANGGLTQGGSGGTGAGNGGNGGSAAQPGSDGVVPGGGGGGRGSQGGSSGMGADGRIVVTYASNAVDLAVTKTASTSSATVGQAVTFTVGITNTSNGTTATNVVVNDLLPSGYTFISAALTPSTGTYVSSTGIWTIGSLASGGSASMVLVGIVNTAGTYNNSASVTANQPDSNTANNSATAVVTVCRAGSSSPLFN